MQDYMMLQCPNCGHIAMADEFERTKDPQTHEHELKCPTCGYKANAIQFGE